MDSKLALLFRKVDSGGRVCVCVGGGCKIWSEVKALETGSLKEAIKSTTQALALVFLVYDVNLAHCPFAHLLLVFNILPPAHPFNRWHAL